MNRHAPELLSRREALKVAALGLGGLCASGWMTPLASRAAEQAKVGRKHKACILLWMDGGPAHLDTFDMKPDAPDGIRGEYTPIATSVPGLQITEKFPQVAKLMHHAAVLRSMSTGEAEHGRARIYLHTGYKPGAGGLKYPTMGSLMTAHRVDEDSEMPNFIVTGMHLNPANWSYVSSPGHLGPRHAPLIVSDLKTGVPYLRPSVETEEFDGRLSLLRDMTSGFLRDRSTAAAGAQETMMQRAVRLMRSPRAKAFDLAQETAKTRETYGDHAFGQGCLLARRLVEAGVPFIEVYHSPTPGGWDNHTAERTKEVKTLTMPQLDQGMSALVSDLHDRGLLQDTLVVWMGEFGRTPAVKKDGGRDHYGRAWSTVLVGGGIQGGQVIGRTDKTGATVEDRPISAVDFMATICGILGVDASQSFQVGDRPVRAVDKGANPVKELLG